LAFALPAVRFSIRNFYHLGARRDEGTLATEIYFEELPQTLAEPSSSKSGLVIVADPMLATGNTMVAVIERLRRLDVPEKNIVVMSVLSAPEGVDHVLHRFPGVRAVVGQHDECLNGRGFIEPGLGDFGDCWCDGLETEAICSLRELAVLSDTSFRALTQRMTAAPVANASVSSR
jgi:uracil phosphoribosyltransferase